MERHQALRCALMFGTTQLDGPACPRYVAHAGDIGVSKDPSPPRTRTITWDDPKAATHQSRRMSGSDFFEAMRRGHLPEAPFGRLLGIDLFDAGEGRFVLTLQPHE